MTRYELLLAEAIAANNERRVLPLEFFENAARTLEAKLPKGSTATLSSGMEPINHSGINGEAVRARDRNYEQRTIYFNGRRTR